MRRAGFYFVNNSVPKAAACVFGSLRMTATDAGKGAEQAQQPPKDHTDLPDGKHEETIRELRKDLKERDDKIAELKKDFLYQAAETENARRIGREDVEKARNFGVQSFSKDILEVADSMEKAIEAFQRLPKDDLENNKAIASIYTGVKMCSSVLLRTLAKHGIEKIEVKVGEKFDPNRHEALFNAPATEATPSGTVAAHVKCGYLIKDRVLRASQVGVAE